MNESGSSDPKLVMRIDDATTETWRIDCVTCGALLGFGLNAQQLKTQVRRDVLHRCSMPANGHAAA